MRSRTPLMIRAILLYVQGIFYIVAGINHFIKPAQYIKIMPQWLPAAAQLVAASGAMEILLGGLLLIPKTKKLAGWGIIALLIAIFPANIQMAVDYIRAGDPNAWATIVRLPVQLLLIWLAYWCALSRPRSASDFRLPVKRND